MSHKANPAVPAAKPAMPAIADARRAARLGAVQTLYQLSFGQERRDGVHLEDGEHIAPPQKKLMQDIILTAMERHATIDDIITRSLDADWPMSRLDQVLRAILRAGVSELLMSNKTTTAVLISDYVDVAHAFFGGKEPGLVNAVLDKVAKLVRQ